MKRRSKSTSPPGQEYSINGTPTKISKFRVPRGDDVFLTIHSILNRELNDAVRTAQHVEAIYTLVYGSGSKHFDDAITEFSWMSIMSSAATRMTCWCMTRRGLEAQNRTS